MTTLLLDQLLASPPATLPPAPWSDLERIDAAVCRAAVRLQEAPWLLAHLLPALESLASERRRCWRSWLAAGDTCDPAALRARLDLEVLAPVEAPPAEPEPAEPELAQVPPTPLESGLIAARPAEEPAPVIVPELAEPALVVAATPATAEQLQAFASEFAKRRLTSPVVHQTAPLLCRQEDQVRAILAQLGEIPERIERDQVAGWRKRLEAATSEAALRRWAELDAALQVNLLTLVVALCRAVQEVGGAAQEPRRVFARLSAYSQREQPGFTHGMARQHQPRHGSWLRDAFAAQGGLRHWLGEPQEVERAPVRPAPKAAVEAAPEPQEEAGDEALIEDDWPWWPQVEGKRAILVGGSPREVSRHRLQEAFRLGKLDWVDGEVRRVDSVTERIRSGGLDLVLLVGRFLSHKVSKKVLHACKSRKIPCAVLESGHGVVAARRAVERYLQAAVTRSVG